MDAETLITALIGRGIFLRVAGDRLVATPASRLTDGDADRIRQLKSALIDELDTRAERRRTHQDCVTCGAALPPSSWLRCPTCVDVAYQARDERHARERVEMGPGGTRWDGFTDRGLGVQRHQEGRDPPASTERQTKMDDRPREGPGHGKGN